MALALKKTDFNFQFEETPVRTASIGNKIAFVAQDVMRSLGYSKAYKAAVAIAHVPDEWKCIYRIDTKKGVRELWCLFEEGLYFFLGRSDKPKALPFQKWVYGEVLPAIRKTGEYRQPEQTNTIAPHEAQALYDFFKDEAKNLFPKNTKGEGEFLKEGWTKLKRHFGVSYKEIPQDGLKTAIEILAKHVADYRADPSRFLDYFGGWRMLLRYDGNRKKLDAQMVPEYAGLNETKNWPRMVREPGGLMMGADWLEDLSLACFERMTPDRKLKSLERQLAYMNEQVDGEKVKMRWLA